MTGMALTSGQFSGQRITTGMSQAEVDKLFKTERYASFDNAWETTKNWFCDTDKAKAEAALLTLVQASTEYHQYYSPLVEEKNYSTSTQDVKHAFDALKLLAGGYGERFTLDHDSDTQTNQYVIEAGDRAFCLTFLAPEQA
ncbi:hypothetical protein [Shewanella surugensis]|uniref:Uncharacterized protein n=1 Tax=Shewanella surugensis TaxID=212020 RepID=A0ABT0LAD3_9GAMM|nr:hypothetical protein [Shewanella surugensis]MCL1124667.1 hypothetical protein [Shewanella surugensis]